MMCPHAHDAGRLEAYVTEYVNDSPAALRVRLTEAEYHVGQLRDARDRAEAELERLKSAIEGEVTCERAALIPDEKARPWYFGPEAACRYLAAVSWPWEREENRDAWAVTMLHRPDLLAREIEAARERLESAISFLTALSDNRTPPGQADPS